MNVTAEDDALAKIAAYSSGDARSGYNVLELAAKLAQERGGQQTKSAAEGGPIHATITLDLVSDALQKRVLLYDKSGEEHYNLISALHKSVRNSDVDASLYWLGRMLASGEDPLYIARRVVRMAVEDIGLASPQALSVTLAAKEAYEFLGSPEGELAIAQAVAYLALAPKSNAIYTAYGEVLEDVEKTAADPVPLHLRNAPTGLMKAFGYGKGYQYAHDLEGKVADMQCLPDNLRDREYFHPTEEGFERDLLKRMEDIRRRRRGSQAIPQDEGNKE
jgi:putative ATPase